MSKPPTPQVPGPLADSHALGLPEIRALAQVLTEFGLSELTLTRAGGDSLSLRREAPAVTMAAPAPLFAHGHALPAPAPAPAGPAAPAAPAPAPTRANVVAVTSPFVGTFYRSARPEAPPFVEVGQRVRKGQTLCIIEAMKLMNELESDVSGVVVECAAQNGRPVEYGQVLFQIDVG